MSAFEGTYLDIALRDANLETFIIVGIALEVGSSRPSGTASI